MKITHLFSLLILLVLGCAYVSHTNVTIQGKGIKAPISGVAVVQGDNINAIVERTTNFRIFHK